MKKNAGRIGTLVAILFIALCATLLITIGQGKSEDKAKIILSKTQIKYEENAKDVLNEYISLRMELMNIGNASAYKNKDDATKKINNIYTRLEKLDTALDSLVIASEEISKTKSEAKLVSTANGFGILTPSAYAAESIDRVKEWAEELTKAYDSYPTGKQLKGLAAYLGTDVKTAMKQLQVAQGVMYNEYENEADMYDDLKDIAEVIQTTAKVELFVAGFPANGVTTLTEAGVTLLNGVDTVVAVSNAGADIILGENHNVTIYTNLLKDSLAPITSITGLLTFDSSSTSNADRIAYIGDSLNSLIFEGKIFGGLIDLNEEDNTYIGKTYETIGASEVDGFKINETESEDLKLTISNAQEFKDILDERKEIKTDIASATANLNEIKTDVKNEIASSDTKKDDKEGKKESEKSEDVKGDFNIVGIYVMDIFNEESGLKKEEGVARLKVERNGNTLNCLDLTEADGEAFTMEYDPATHIATASGIIKMVLEFSSDGGITYSLLNPQTGEGSWVLKGHRE